MVDVRYPGWEGIAPPGSEMMRKRDEVEQMIKRNHRRIKASAAMLLAVACLLMIIPQAGATPISDKQSELQRIKSEVQTLDAQLETVVEQYNMTNVRADQIRASINQNESKLNKLRADLSFRQDVLSQRIRELYKQGNTDMIEVLTECKSVDDFVSNVDMITRVGSHDAVIISDVMDAESQLEGVAADLDAQKAELTGALNNLSAQKAQIEGAVQQRQSLVAGVESDINNLIAQEEANRAPSSYTAPRRSPNYVPPAPPNANAPLVVRIAYAQLGKPYVYAGSGPDVFDCSGLVMYCYAQIGIDLPHSSYMQCDCGPRVAYEDLQPGDLVFFHGYGHVGMYVGDGQYIHAPRTGDVVRVADLSVRSDFCGACRIL